MMVGPTPEVERSPMLSEDDVKRTASHVRTKKRVSDHGEVLTGQREVNAMLEPSQTGDGTDRLQVSRTRLRRRQLPERDSGT